jgi:hypothetical protein
MDKFLRSLITVERIVQISALVGVMLFLGYLGVNSLQRDRATSGAGISPATPLK